MPDVLLFKCIIRVKQKNYQAISGKPLFFRYCLIIVFI
jgi:hypothetical protein